MNGSVADEFDDDTLREIMETSANLMDMYADTEEGLYNISVSIEDLGAIYGALLDEEGYLNVSL